MAVNGISFGSHTVTGAYLPDVTHDERVREITESRRMLEEALDAPVEFIAYPVGGFSNDVKEIVRAAGYRAACATNRGHDRTGKDLYEIKRIRVKDTDAGLKLWIKLSGYYNLIRRTKEPF